MAPGSIEPSGPVDKVHLGRRLRGARRTIGKAVQVLADETGLTPEQINDVEAGRVLPDDRQLTALARHTKTSPDALISGPDSAALIDIKGYLDNAELLHSSREGTAELLRAVDCALDRLAGSAAPEVERAARRLRATALERSGDLQGAVDELLVVTAEPVAETQWLTDLIALSRCYRESGQLNQAIDVGESRREAIHALGLADSTEAIRLTVTVAGAYIFRAAEGDLGHATRLCMRAARTAESHDLPLARASALWNASVARYVGGDTTGALDLGLEALQLYEVSGDTRNLGVLRTQVANVYLAQRPPVSAAALDLLMSARAELDWANASVLERARHHQITARALHEAGEPDAAAAELRVCDALIPENAVELRAWQLVLRGQLAADHRDVEGARRFLHEAVGLLSGSGADGDVAQAWFKLGDVFAELGEDDLAADAYRRAGASHGLRPLA